MDPQKAKSIFLHAVEHVAPNEWPNYLSVACSDDPSLRHDVEALLAAHQNHVDLADQARQACADALPAIAQPLTEKPGDILGPYKLLQQLGEGGMGVVYLAEQSEPVERRVALKIIMPGMDTRKVIARFEAERQALAMMDHPNIAKVFEAGTTDTGRPFFVMELVKGVSVTQYCDEKQLTPRERLQLFVPICQAVQHAHQKGIIHRDIKPSNILVAQYDDKAVPKIIDFGVAKAIEQRLTEKTAFTEFGQVVGTPEYMSPEQAKLNQLDIDTRTDVYSLGVLLYELLTGETPFDRERLRSAAFDELLWIIREEEPPRPSLRLSTSESLPSIAANRHVEPTKLSALVRGELDWIVMKALEKNRSRRYETASGLARDVERHLHDEPVVACPPTAVYRFGKFVRRNKAAMITAGVVSAALLVGVVVSTWQTFRAVAAEREAKSERDRAVEAQRAERRQRQLAERQSYVADMNMAHQAWEAGDVDGMTRLLERYQGKGVRGFQWRHLWHLSERNRNTPFVDHGTRILSMDISPDGETLATVGYGPFLKLWDVRSQQLLEEIPGLWLVAATAFSPDGNLLAYQGADGFHLRDLSGDNEDRSLSRTTGALSAAFSPGGTRLAAAGFGGVVFLWDLESGQALTLEGHEFVIWKLAFSPDGKTLASAGSHELILWNAESGEKRHVLSTGANIGQCVAFAPDGKTLATGGQDGAVGLWNPLTGELQETFLGQVPGGICSLAYSSDGRLAAGSWDGTVVLLDSNTGARLDVLKGHQQQVFVLRFSKDNGTLASASFDGTVKLWDVRARRPPDLLEGHTESVTSLAVSGDGSLVVSGGADGTIRLWDVKSSEELAACQLHDFPVEAVAISPDGKTVASVSWGGKTVFTNLVSGQSEEFPEGMPNSAAFVPDSTKLAVGSNSGNLTIWDIATHTNTPLRPGHEQMIRAVAISPNGKLIATGSWDNTIKLGDADTGNEWQTLGGHSDSVECLAFSPDGKTLASGGCDNTVILWNVNSRERQGTLTGHTAPVKSLSFSPDGKILSSGANDRTIRLWYLNTSKEPEILPEYAPVTSVAFSPDGATLISASGNHVRLWRTIANGEPLEVTRLADLQRRARAIAAADPQEQRQILDDVKSHLAARATKRLLLSDIILAASTAWRLADSGHRELANEALRSFANVIMSGNDSRYAEWVIAWEAHELQN